MKKDEEQTRLFNILSVLRCVATNGVSIYSAISIF